MRNQEAIKKRFMRDPVSVRVGGLASDLARIAFFSKTTANKELIKDLLEESRFFVEWTAPEASLEVQELLVKIQIELALWLRRWTRLSNNPNEVKVLSKSAKMWSDDILEASGLLASQ